MSTYPLFGGFNHEKPMGKIDLLTDELPHLIMSGPRMILGGEYSGRQFRSFSVIPDLKLAHDPAANNDELLKEATRRYHVDPVFKTNVEYAIMYALRHRMKAPLINPDNLQDVKEMLRISASIALVLEDG